MPKHLFSIMSLIAAAVLFVMLFFTTPVEIGPLGVLVFFVAIYVLVFGFALIMVKIITRLSGRRVNKKTYLYSAVISFEPIMMLLAQSLGSVSWWSVGLMAIFGILACFLISKRL